MSGRKKENFERDRVEFMADPAWIERVVNEAARLGLNLSSFIRMVVTQALDRSEAERGPAPRTKNKRKPPPPTPSKE